MSDLPAPTSISPEDWAATPIAVRQLVVVLIGQIAELPERVNKASRNSSPITKMGRPEKARPGYE